MPYDVIPTSKISVMSERNKAEIIYDLTVDETLTLACVMDHMGPASPNQARCSVVV